MSKPIVTIEDINRSLYSVYLDTEYKEALASALIDLKYVNDSPLNLSLGTFEQKRELYKVETRPLKSKELKEIINYMINKMKDDFQYKDFEPIALKYLDIANKMELKEKEEEEEFE